MKTFLTAFICLLLTIPCVAATITVDDDGPADFNNIQAAIDVASKGDEVAIAPGTYTGPANRNIEVRNKPITIRSTDPNDPNIVTVTIIDCENASRAFWIKSFDEDTNYIISGLTITNGKADGGAGVYCTGSPYYIANCIIINCHFVNCSAQYYGGAVCSLGSFVSVISNCSFMSNSAASGSAIALRYGGLSDLNPRVDNCLISNNTGNARDYPFFRGLIQVPTIYN